VTIPHQLASTAREDFRNDPTYHPPNLGAFLNTHPDEAPDVDEVVVRLPADQRPPGSPEPTLPEEFRLDRDRQEMRMDEQAVLAIGTLLTAIAALRRRSPDVAGSG
jgi:hypothetical protein